MIRKRFSYYFFSRGEIIEEVDENEDSKAFSELNKRGYRVKGFFDYYTRYDRVLEQMELFKV